VGTRTRAKCSPRGWRWNRSSALAGGDGQTCPELPAASAQLYSWPNFYFPPPTALNSTSSERNQRETRRAAGPDTAGARPEGQSPAAREKRQKSPVWTRGERDAMRQSFSSGQAVPPCTLHTDTCTVARGAGWDGARSQHPAAGSMSAGK